MTGRCRCSSTSQIPGSYRVPPPHVPHLDEAFELVVLRQELRLFLLQGEDVFRRLLQDGRLVGADPRSVQAQQM